MSRVFISHAVADRELAELLVDHLTDAIGVTPDAIFCSSVPGHGVPFTTDFNERMRLTLNDAALVVLLMTPSYMDSEFCLMELGAAWSRSLRMLPIVVHPITFDQVTKTIGLTQGWNLAQTETLSLVRKTVLEALDVSGHSSEYYERKRRRWETSLPDVLSRLSSGAKVYRAELEIARVTIGSLEKGRDDLETELADFRRQAKEEKARRPSAIILESEGVIADDLQNLLGELGVNVVGRASRENEAVELALRVRPSIVLSETVLAGGDSGLRAVRKIVQQTDATAVFVTARPEDLLSSDRPELAHLVSKPFDRIALKKTIVEALQRVVDGFVPLR